MKNLTQNINRRKALALFATATIIAPIKALAQNTSYLNAIEMGLVANSATDQSEIFQFIIEKAAQLGQQLFVPSGNYKVSNIDLPSNFSMSGILGATIFSPANNQIVFNANYQENISLSNFEVNGLAISDHHLFFLRECKNILIENISLKNSGNGGFFLEKCQGKISNCNISKIKQAAIHIQDSLGMFVNSNIIDDCKNGGILVWRYEPAIDGTIITENRISNIGSESGSGQNGNGINTYQADEVIIANNKISQCDFSAIRVNSTRNTIITGNICNNCKEVAIFSEFAFSGSIISDNIIDQAAQGISVTNFDHGGHLSVCSGNIVRNIWASSPTNPDARPIAIYAEADCAVHGNLIEKVPGIGIVAGWGPYLRNVSVLQNIISDIKIGVAASVVDGAGIARISDNIITNASFSAIVAMTWLEIVGADLDKENKQYSNLIIKDNIVNQ